MRGVKEVRSEVLSRAGRYQVVRNNLSVKEVRVGERRYVVRFNPDEAAKDRSDREKILDTLKSKLASGGVKKLIPNRGYRRYLRVAGGRFEIDERQVREEERFDGKYVLRTTTELPAEEVAHA